MGKKKSSTEEPPARTAKPARPKDKARSKAARPRATAAARGAPAKPAAKAPRKRASRESVAAPAPAKPAERARDAQPARTKKAGTAKPAPPRRPSSPPPNRSTKAAPPPPAEAAPPKPKRTGPASAADLLGVAAGPPRRVFEVPEPALVEGRWRKAHAALLRARDRILDSMDNLAGSNLKRSHTDETPSYGGMDEGDVGLESYDRDFALNLLSNGQNLLNEVESALRRIAQGTYGECEVCGKPIPAIRLRAVPYAHCCVACQSQEERRQRTAALLKRSAIAKERLGGQE